MPTRLGTVPAEVSQAIADGRFTLPSRSGRLSTTATQTVWNVPVILVAFADQPFSTNLYGGATAGQYFERQLFDTTGTTPTGSVFDYYQWVSGNRVRVVGKVVASVTLPNPKDYYANNNWGLGFQPPRNAYGLATAALQLADPLVDWRPYDQDHDGYVDVVWFLHSGYGAEAPPVLRSNLWSATSRLSSWPSGERYQTLTTVPGAPSLRMSVDRISMVPELSAVRPGVPSEIGVYCHEFGHTLGLPDLYDTSFQGGGQNAGPGNWNLMATGGYGTDGGSPEYPASLGAWSLLYLGWRQTFRPTTDTVLVQTPLAHGGPIVEFWFQGESNPEHFLIENRRREGFDRNIPAEGLLVYHVNEDVIASGMAANRVNAGVVPGLQIVEADGQYDIPAGRNRGDDRDPFPGLLERTQIDDGTSPNTRTFSGGLTGIAMREITPIGDDVRYRLRVRPAGWQPAVRAATPGPYKGILPASLANRLVRFPDRSLAMISDELVAGRPQVMLRTRAPQAAWGAGMQLSLGPGSASDPTIAAVPGGNDLVVVWSDSRFGAGELYYRSRVGGVWSRERRLTDLLGDSRYPSVGVDRSGRVHVAWLYTQTGPQVKFMTFPYRAPSAAPITVTQIGDLPAAPVVAVAGEGRSYVLWSDRATPPARIWLAAYNPATGIGAKQKIIGSSFEQPAVDAVVDSTGALDVVWQESGSGVNQIHYQKRKPDGSSPFPLDATLVSRGESVQNPTLRIDEQGGLHLAFVGNTSGVQQVRYMRWQPDGGWDCSSTELTAITDGSAARPAIAAFTPDEVSVLYIGFPGGVMQPMERQRVTETRPVAVPEPGRPAPALALRLGPNPLPAGASLHLRTGVAAGSEAEAVEFFDLAGRRVAAVPLVTAGAEASTDLSGESTRGWRSGVYFARMRGFAAPATRLVVIR